ncbi:hypothetical protein ACHAXS_008977 [Conticribra weissflogii]
MACTGGNTTKPTKLPCGHLHLQLTYTQLLWDLALWIEKAEADPLKPIHTDGVDNVLLISHHGCLGAQRNGTSSLIPTS